MEWIGHLISRIHDVMYIDLGLKGKVHIMILDKSIQSLIRSTHNSLNQFTLHCRPNKLFPRQRKHYYVSKAISLLFIVFGKSLIGSIGLTSLMVVS